MIVIEEASRSPGGRNENGFLNGIVPDYFPRLSNPGDQ